MDSHSSPDIVAMSAELAQIAARAGDVLRRMQQEALNVALKADGSPVSAADEASEQVISTALRAAFPTIPVISEENAQSHAKIAQDRFFLVDPLDGTKAYLAGGPDYCVLIALIEHGVPVVAAIDLPVAQRTYQIAGSVNSIGRDGTIVPLRTQSCDNRARVAVISSHHAQDSSEALCRECGAKDIRYENSALKFIRLAEGEADVYPRPGRTMQWDIAAGDALLRATGGVIKSRDGKPLRYGFGSDGWANPEFIAWRCKDDASGR